MIEQGSELWLMQRRGHLSASRLHDAVTKGARGAYSAKRADIMWTLIEERITGQAAPHFVTAEMQWGIDTEPQAKALYSFLTDQPVDPAPYVPHAYIPMTGASPDGYVGDKGLIEVKCPKTKTHLQTLAAKEVPVQYITQMQWQMECTGRHWCDFVSFDPRLPEDYQIWIHRVDRDDAMIETLKDEIVKFEAELNQLMGNLK
jgi:putative phage-type endonuclease